MAEPEIKSWLEALTWERGCMVCGNATAYVNRDSDPYRTRLCLTHQNQLDRILMQSVAWSRWYEARIELYATEQYAARHRERRCEISPAVTWFYEEALEAHDFIAATIASLKAEWEKEHPVKEQP